MKKFTFLLVFSLISTLFLRAQSFEQTQKIVAGDGNSDGRFGYAVDVSEKFLAVGATNASGKGSGAVYVFIKNGGSWLQLGKLTPSSGNSPYSFGNSVSIYNSDIVVGDKMAGGQGQNCGAAYVYHASGGTWQEQKLWPADLNGGCHFGSAVAIFNDHVIVGSENYNTKGAIYYYKRDVNGIWEQMLSIKSSSYNSFGSSVDMNDEYAVVGASKSGEVYVYKMEEDTLIELTSFAYGGSEGEFGHSVSLSDKYIAVGAWKSSDKGENAGAVYMFQIIAGFWTMVGTLYPDDIEAGDYFGSSVGLYGDYLVVGASGKTIDTLAENSGVAYVFYNNNGIWEQIQELQAGDLHENSCFGNAIAMYDNEIVVGASHASGNVNDVGAVYVYCDDAVGMVDHTSVDFRVYPNPVNNELNVKYDGDHIDLLRMLDLTGKSVLERYHVENHVEIDVSGLRPGVYVMNLYDGKNVVTRKIVKN
jgi:hypothetical protein